MTYTVQLESCYEVQGGRLEKERERKRVPYS